jgi:hypothetical protein
MEIKLSFNITFVSGEQTTQDITVKADPNHPVETQMKALMQQMFGQYVSVGMLRQPEKDHYVLLCPSQIAMVECKLPSIILADATEIPVPRVTLD